MTRYLHTLSAVLFYVLGSTVAVAYVLTVNNILAAGAGMWMHAAFLPLTAAALLYGGTSIYLSITSEHGPSRQLGMILGILFGVVFLAITILTFLPMTFDLNS